MVISNACEKLANVLKDVARSTPGRLITLMEIMEKTGIERRHLISLLIHYHRSNLIVRLHLPDGRSCYSWNVRDFPLNN
jgi:hypothetical protein